MNRRFLLILTAMLLLGIQLVFAKGSAPPEPLNKAPAKVSANSAQSLPDFPESVSFLWSHSSAGPIDFLPSRILAAAGTTDAEIPGSIRNNKYFLESVRLTNLAQDAFDEGDYDASAQYSEDAVRYAQLSDEYVRLQLKIKETDDAIAAARGRLDFAASVNAAARYPSEYSQAQASYNDARSLRSAEKWDDAIAAANRVLAFLANVNAEGTPARPPEPVRTEGPTLLPAQYTVRPWNDSRDCLWNIAGRPWVFNDPRQWRLLYDANRSRMPESDNPDLIHPGFVLNIPSFKGETRQGMWDTAKSYPPLP